MVGDIVNNTTFSCIGLDFFPGDFPENSSLNVVIDLSRVSIKHTFFLQRLPIGCCLGNHLLKVIHKSTCVTNDGIGDFNPVLSFIEVNTFPKEIQFQLFLEGPGVISDVTA